MKSVIAEIASSNKYLKNEFYQRPSNVRNITPDDQFLDGSNKEHYYLLGGVVLSSTVEFPQLVAFKVDSSKVTALNVNSTTVKSKSITAFKQAKLTTDALNLRYKGSAPFDGAVRQIEYLCDQHHGLVRIDGTDAYFLDLSTQTAICVLADPSGRLALEVMLGPVTVLFFRARNRYCLHAGCVATPNGAIALIAESGIGKSTLSATHDDDWQQISDDVIVVDAESLLISGAFPQLKLPTAQSDYFAVGASKSPLPIAAFVRLAPEPTDQILIEPVTPRDALLEIVRHSVGAKLFDAQELQSHTLFSAQLAHLVPMWRASYPRDLEQLPNVRESIVNTIK